MEYTEIIAEITGQLTGNWEEDKHNLDAASEQYKHHPQGTAILRAIGRLMFEHMPATAKKEWQQACANHGDYYQTVLAEILHAIRERNYSAAEQLLVKILPDEKLFAEDEASVYWSFQNPLEHLFYLEKFKPAKQARNPTIPYNEIYKQYVFVLVEKKDFANALRWADIALQRNPLFTSMYFEKAEIHKLSGDLEAFLATSIEALNCSYRTYDIARYLRNIGYYLIEKQLWDEAIFAYALSTNLHQSEMAGSQMMYIAHKSGLDVNAVDLIQAQIKFDRLNIPIRFDELWPALAMGLAEHCYGQQDFAKAAEYYEIVCGLANHEPAALKLRECREKIGRP